MTIWYCPRCTEEQNTAFGCSRMISISMASEQATVLVASMSTSYHIAPPKSMAGFMISSLKQNPPRPRWKCFLSQISTRIFRTTILFCFSWLLNNRLMRASHTYRNARRCGFDGGRSQGDRWRGGLMHHRTANRWAQLIAAFARQCSTSDQSSTLFDGCAYHSGKARNGAGLEKQQSKAKAAAAWKIEKDYGMFKMATTTQGACPIVPIQKAVDENKCRSPIHGIFSGASKSQEKPRVCPERPAALWQLVSNDTKSSLPVQYSFCNFWQHSANFVARVLFLSSSKKQTKEKPTNAVCVCEWRILTSLHGDSCDSDNSRWHYIYTCGTSGDMYVRETRLD